MGCDTTAVLIIGAAFCFNLLILWILIGHLLDLGAQVTALATSVSALALVVSHCDAVQRVREIHGRMDAEHG
jgi:hypothetical protein